MLLLVRWAVALVVVMLTAAAADAHPLGNFTVNHLTRLNVHHGQVEVRYVLDEAEIPSFAVLRSLDPHGAPSSSALRGWARETADATASALVLRADGTRLALVPGTVSVATRPGAGGLRTIYLRAQYAAPLPAQPARLTLRDESFAGRIGWHDVVIGGEHEPTDELRTYPSALLGSPRDRLARAARLAGGRLWALAPRANAPATVASLPLTRSDALSAVLVRGASDPLVILGALLLAIGLGALHALEPGHGKTLLAVSLVGARASAAQALILAASLTLAHTAGVVVLGVVLLAFAHWIVPETIYPWLTLLSGALVVALGARALSCEVARRRPAVHVHLHEHDHAHPHVHEHAHAVGEHDHHAHAHAIPGSAPLTFRSALLAATSGNIAPCPAALVVLLAAIALHRVAYGLALIVAFSLGLALVLTGLGIAVVRGAAWLAANPRFDRFARHAPLVTAAVISVLGASILAQGLVQQGLQAPAALVAALILAAVGGYALTAPAQAHPHPHAHAQAPEGAV